MLHFELINDIKSLSKDIKTNKDIDPRFLGLFGNPAALWFLEKNQKEKLYVMDWDNFSKNPAALWFLEKNQNKIDWRILSANPAALHLLEKNQDKIDKWGLSRNYAALHLLEKNPDKINWVFFIRKSCCFEFTEKKSI